MLEVWALRIMASSSSSHSSTVSANEGPGQNCHCKLNAELLVSWAPTNPGRRFYRCRFRGARDCRFWQWCDDELTDPYYKEVILSLRAKTMQLTKTNKMLEKRLSDAMDEREDRVQVRHGQPETFVESGASMVELKAEMDLYKRKVVNASNWNKVLCIFTGISWIVIATMLVPISKA